MRIKRWLIVITATLMLGSCAATSETVPTPTKTLMPMPTPSPLPQWTGSVDETWTYEDWKEYQKTSNYVNRKIFIDGYDIISIYKDNMGICLIEAKELNSTHIIIYSPEYKLLYSSGFNILEMEKKDFIKLDLNLENDSEIILDQCYYFWNNNILGYFTNYGKMFYMVDPWMLEKIGLIRELDLLTGRDVIINDGEKDYSKKDGIWTDKQWAEYQQTETFLKRKINESYNFYSLCWICETLDGNLMFDFGQKIVFSNKRELLYAEGVIPIDIETSDIENLIDKNESEVIEQFGIIHFFRTPPYNIVPSYITKDAKIVSIFTNYKTNKIEGILLYNPATEEEVVYGTLESYYLFQ